MQKKLCGTIILFTIPILLSQTARADFEDTVPNSFGDANVKPLPISPQKSSTAPVSGASTGATPTPQSQSAPQRTPQTSNEANTNSTTPADSGDFFSGEAFSDITHNSAAPVSVKARDFTGSRKTGMYKLKGNVVVIQETLTMNSDIMEIFTENGLSKPQKILAKKNVHVVKIANPAGTDKVQAWADEMEYNLQTGKMHLKKGARITRGKNCTILGDILEYDLTEGNVSGRAIRGTCPPPNRTKPAQ
jgi:lipopolysaccharide transport protein LptA